MPSKAPPSSNKPSPSTSTSTSTRTTTLPQKNRKGPKPTATTSITTSNSTSSPKSSSTSSSSPSTNLTLTSLLPVLPLPLPLPTGVSTAATLGTATAISRGRDATRQAKSRAALKELVVSLAVPAASSAASPSNEDEGEDIDKSKPQSKSESEGKVKAKAKAQTKPQERPLDQTFRNARVVLRRGSRKLWAIPSQDLESEVHTNQVHPIHQAFHPRPYDTSAWKSEGYASTGQGAVCTIPLPPSYERGEAEGVRKGVEDEGEQEVLLNWLFVERESGEVLCGTRGEGEGRGNLMGPWDLMADVDGEDGDGGGSGGEGQVRVGPEEGQNVTFQDWEGFVVVEERWEDEWSGDQGWGWALYFDVDDDGLTSQGRVGCSAPGWKVPRILEVEVQRREPHGGVSKGSVNEEAMWELEKGGRGIRTRVGRVGVEASSQRGAVEVTRERKKGNGPWTREKGTEDQREPEFEYGHLEVREEVED